MSTLIRVVPVFAKKPRRVYRKRMELYSYDIEKISGADVKQTRLRQYPGLSRQAFGKLLKPRVLPETLRKIENYVPGVEDPQTIKAGPIKMRVCSMLALLPTNVSDMTDRPKNGQEAAKPERRGDFLAFLEPQWVDADGGYMSVLSTDAQQMIKRPSYATDPKAWVIEMVGHTMWPEYRDGSKLFISPSREPQPGLGCVFVSSDRTRFRVLVFVEKTADGWIAEQRHPPERMVMPSSEWEFCEHIEAAQAPRPR